jgi:hypothetical protein
MNILALDIGTRSGWAIADEDAPPLPAPSPLFGDEAGAKRALLHYHHGSWSPDTALRGRFFLRFTEWLTRKVDTFDVGLIAVEASVEAWMNMGKPDAKGRRATNPDTIRKLLGIVAHVESVAALRGLEIDEINTARMTKLAVGTGRDPNKKLRKERGRALGLQVGHDELDAIYGLSSVLHKRQAARRAREAA